LHEDFAQSYARAREDQMHAWADQIVTFADNGTFDVMLDEDGKPIRKANGEPKLYRQHIDRTKLRIDTRKWLMAKILPTVFGDKLEVTGTVTWEQKDDAELLHGLQEAMDKSGLSLEDLQAMMGGEAVH
jgi:hypothetical protein